MSSSASIGDQDELHARRKLEQKRRFQQTQGKAPTDVDSLMQSMFTDLKLPNKGSMISQVKDATISSETKKTNDILDVSHHPADPPAKTNAASAGAADWSKITFDDELNRIFQTETVEANYSEEQKFVYQQPALKKKESVSMGEKSAY